MTMDSALMRFLQEDYPMHLGLEKGQKVTVQREEYGKGEFDFRDENDKKDEKKEWFSSRIRNESNTPFEVISFEAYIDMLRSDKRVKKEKKIWARSATWSLALWRGVLLSCLMN